jgi:hypothetical protein
MDARTKIAAAAHGPSLTHAYATIVDLTAPTRANGLARRSG